MGKLLRYYSVIWAASSFLAVGFWLKMQHSFLPMKWFYYSSWVAFFYLLYNSRSLRGPQAVYLMGGMALLVLGQAFKVMHWPFAFELQLLAGLVVSFGYALFVIRRTRKRWIDLFKLLFVITSCITYIVLLLKMPWFDVLEKLSLSLFWLVYLYISILELQGFDQSQEDPPRSTMPGDVL